MHYVKEVWPIFQGPWDGCAGFRQQVLVTRLVWCLGDGVGQHSTVEERRSGQVLLCCCRGKVDFPIYLYGRMGMSFSSERS